MIGPREYTTTYVTSKIQGWCDETKIQSEIVDTYPYAVYAAFTHGLFSCWSYTYIMQTIPDIQDHLQPLENGIHQHLIPALFGHLCETRLVCTSGTTWQFRHV